MHKIILFLITSWGMTLTIAAPSGNKLQTEGYCSPVISNNQNVKVICGLPAPLVRKLVKKFVTVNRKELRKLKDELSSISRQIKTGLRLIVKTRGDNNASSPWKVKLQTLNRKYNSLLVRLESLRTLARNQNLEFQKSIAFARELIKQYKNREQPVSASNQLLLNLQNGDYLRNIKRLKDRLKTLREAGDNKKTLLAATYFALGRHQYMIGDYTKSIASYEKSIRLAPGNTQYRSKAHHAYNSRGIKYNTDKKYRRAIKDFTRAIELDGTGYAPYFNRAFAYERLFQIHLAMNDYSKAIELNPAFYHSYISRARIYSRMGVSTMAVKDLDKAIKLNPAHPTTYLYRGFAYSRLRRYDQAIRDFTKVIQLNPGAADGYSRRALAYAESRQYDKAISDYNSALRIQPNDPYTYINRGLVFYKKRLYQKSINDFNQAIRIAPNFPLAYLNRAHVYKALDKKSSARVCRDINKACSMAYRPACKAKSAICGSSVK